jgi:hypothetical protein
MPRTTGTPPTISSSWHSATTARWYLYTFTLLIHSEPCQFFWIGTSLSESARLGPDPDPRLQKHISNLFSVNKCCENKKGNIPFL